MWYAGGCVGLQLVKLWQQRPTSSRLRSANVTVMEVARIRGQLTPDKKLCCCKKAARCFVSVSSYLQYKTSSAIFYYTLALDLPLRKLNYVLFSSAYSLVHGFLCRKQTCTATVIHHWTGDRQLIALAPAVIDR